MHLNVKRCRKVLAVFLGMCLVLSGCSKKTEETTNDISSVKLKSNQEIVACKITAIYGNEIEYTVVKEQSESDSNSKKGRMPSASGAPDMNGESSQFEDRQNSSLDKNSSQSSSDSSDKESDSSKSSDKSSKKIYTLTDETGSTTIPVGTDVITSLGKTTTFSRLSNGDIIKMIMEKDSSGEKVVVGVWIVS